VSPCRPRCRTWTEFDCRSPTSPAGGEDRPIRPGAVIGTLRPGWSKWSATCALTTGLTADPSGMREFGAGPSVARCARRFSGSVGLVECCPHTPSDDTPGARTGRPGSTQTSPSRHASQIVELGNGAPPSIKPWPMPMAETRSVSQPADQHDADRRRNGCTTPTTRCFRKTRKS
jgi:hypothetical protein